MRRYKSSWIFFHQSDTKRLIYIHLLSLCNLLLHEHFIRLWRY
jgi:hypothetical protein